MSQGATDENVHPNRIQGNNSFLSYRRSMLVGEISIIVISNIVQTFKGRLVSAIVMSVVKML